MAGMIIRLWSQIREDTLETIDKFSDQDLQFYALKNGVSVGEITQHIAQEEYGVIQYSLTFKLDTFPAQFGDKDDKTINTSKA